MLLCLSLTHTHTLAKCFSHHKPDGPVLVDVHGSLCRDLRYCLHVSLRLFFTNRVFTCLPFLLCGLSLNHFKVHWLSFCCPLSLLDTFLQLSSSISASAAIFCRCRPLRCWNTLHWILPLLGRGRPKCPSALREQVGVESGRTFGPTEGAGGWNTDEEATVCEAGPRQATQTPSTWPHLTRHCTRKTRRRSRSGTSRKW